jgi:hypothetical protein
MCLYSSTKTRVVQAWWGSTSFSRHCQTAPEPGFRWTVDIPLRPCQLTSVIPWPQYSGGLVVGTHIDFGAFGGDQWLIDIRATSGDCPPGDWIETRNLDRLRTSVLPRAESCVEMHGNNVEHLLQRSYEHRPYISRFWFLDKCWLGIFAQLFEYHTLLKPVTNFDHSVYK